MALSTFHSGSILAQSTLLNIPDDYATIQSAIDFAADGDTVFVADLVYKENIDFIGKFITVASHFLTTQDSKHINATVICGVGEGDVVSFVSGEDSTAVLIGFTLTSGLENGNVIYCKDSHPLLDNLVITRNEYNEEEEHFYGYKGTGIYCFQSSPTISNISIIENHSRAMEFVHYSNPILTHIRMHEKYPLSYNWRDMSMYYESGGIICRDNSCPELTHVSSNGSSSTGISCYDSSNPTIKHTSILNSHFTGFYCYNSSPVLEDVKIMGIHGIVDSNATGLKCTGRDSKPILKNVVISSVRGEYRCTGIICGEYTAPIINNVIIRKLNPDGALTKCILVSDNSSPIIRNVIISDITSDYITHGIHCSPNSIPDIANVIVNGLDYGIYNENGNPKISNSIFWKIKKDLFHGLDNSFGTLTTVNANGDSSDRYYNIFKDPLLYKSGLLNNSPCIGAGTTEGAPKFDIAGNPRGTPPDIGAYENPLDHPTYYTGVSDFAEVFQSFHLYPCSPNPFNPSTTINFTLPSSEFTSLVIYNLGGQKIRTLVAEDIQPGAHSVVWDGRNDQGVAVSSGIYLSRLKSGKHTATGKMLLMK